MCTDFKTCTCVFVVARSFVSPNDRLPIQERLFDAMPYFQKAADTSSEKEVLEPGLPDAICAEPNLAAHLFALAITSVRFGYYAQIGSTKRGNSYVIAFKKTGEDIVIYFNDLETLISEFSEMLSSLNTVSKPWATAYKNAVAMLQDAS